MAISSEPTLVVDYDEERDVLYASVGPSQPAISDEVEDDVLLRYCPPSPQVVGITVMNFRRHFPWAEPVKVIQHFLHAYPVVPWPVEDA